jgi:hypothetical protein
MKDAYARLNSMAITLRSIANRSGLGWCAYAVTPQVHLVKVAYYPELRTQYLTQFTASDALVQFIAVSP